jgi:hypothetical protein
MLSIGRWIGSYLGACLVDIFEGILEGLQKPFHLVCKYDYGPSVEGFPFSLFAFDDAEKDVTISILFYVEEIRSAFTSETSRKKFSSNTHPISLSLGFILYDPRPLAQALPID